MDNDEAGKVSEREEAVCTSDTIFDGANTPLDFRYVFIFGTCVEYGVESAEWLKFVIGEDGGDCEASVLVGADDTHEFVPNCGLTLVL
jgi:hypothetical protein